MDARELRKKRDLAASIMVAGPAVECAALAVFFGGSGRDPAWIWALYILCFYGGLAAGLAGLIWLAWLAFQTPS